MKLLAIDTSSVTATVALLDEDKLLGEYTLSHKMVHSERLMLMIEEILNNCDVKPKEIDVFAVSLGPGSFTGLRIGIATMATMAQALDKKIVGVPTLEALAYNLYNISGLICPVIDAQRDLVYTALYQWTSGDMAEIMKQQVISIDGLINVFTGKRDSTESPVFNSNDRLVDILEDKSRKIFFVGDGLERFNQNLKDSLGQRFAMPPPKFLIPSASSVAEVAKIKIEKDIETDIVPIYMRKSGAEVQYEKRMKGRK